MAKILVIFGSRSDEKVYKQILRGLKKNNIDYDLRILSAHRTPAEIDAVDLQSYSLIIAGAGLSAALPGVVASKTIRQVIGVPIGSDFQGLDALLSIMQMPPGIAVLSVGVEQADMAVQNAVGIARDHEGVTLVGDQSSGPLAKAKSLLESFDVPYKISEKPDKDTVNIEFTFFDEPVEQKDELVIYCPLLPSDSNKAEASLNLLKHSSHGLWVGLNNGKNAALAAVQILNNDNRYTEKLEMFRQEMKEKVIAADKGSN